MFNRIKEFLSSYPDSVSGKSSTSAYRFWQDTQLSRTTAYRLYNDRGYIPTGDVLDKVCSTYKIKPGLILDWEPNNGPQAIGAGQDQLEVSEPGKEPSVGNRSKEHKHVRTFLTLIIEEPESA